MKKIYITSSKRVTFYFIFWISFVVKLLTSTQSKAQPISLGCNAFTSLTATSPASASLSVETSTFTTGAPSVTVTGNSYNDAGNLIDANTNNTATKALLAVTGTHWIEVRDNSTNQYPGGSFAGFVVNNNELADVFSAITITTYLGATKQDEFSGGSLLSSALPGGNRGLIGFVTSATKPFNRIRFTYSSTVSLGSISLYSAVVKRFCNGPDLLCNTPTILNESVYPVAIDPVNTGFGGVSCVGCAISNAENAIDASSSTAATISALVPVGSTASFAVKNQLQNYPTGTLAGFDLETLSLASADLLKSITVALYNKGAAVQTGTGNDLVLGVTSTALTGNSRQVVGLVSKVAAFDEVKITFTRLTDVNLGAVYLYSTIIQRSCAATLLCNTTYYLKNPEFPSVINSQRTGITNTACALCGVSNSGNLINTSLTDFASLSAIAGVGAQASVSVQDPAGTYPAGSYTGFVIKRNSLLVDLALLGNVTITTYNDGIVSESKTSANLLDLTLLFNIFGPENNTTYNIGFETNKPFDEMQISVAALGGVNQYVDVYSAFVDTRTAFGANLACFKTNPDFAVTLKNVPVSGSVKTNDIAGAGTTYGNPVILVSSPVGSTPTLTVNPDGAYSFSSTTPGAYVYQVTVCPPGQTTACHSSPFTITVLDPSVSTNPPVANVDFASVQSSPTSPGSVTVNVTANDGPGNIGGALSTPTLTVNPAHGTASIQPGTGKLIYTPATGYVGLDALTYQVCEAPGGRCASAQVVVTVRDQGSTIVTVADDYVSTAQNIQVSGSVTSNDQGAGLTVTNPATMSVPGKGTLVLTSAGEYTFTPVENVTGPVTFTYTACDNSATAVCGTGTLHILVVPVPELTPIIYARPSVSNGTSEATVVVDVIELNNVATNRPVVVKVTKDALVNLTFPSSATSVDNRPVNNSVWRFDNTSDEDYYILTTNQIINAGDQLSFGLSGMLMPGATAGTLPISAVIVENAGGEAKGNNNVDADKIDYFQQ